MFPGRRPRPGWNSISSNRQPPQAEQVVGDGTFRAQAFDERGARLRVDEARGVERLNARVGRLSSVPEHRFEMRIGGERGARGGADLTDVDAFVNGLKQPCEGVCAGLRQAQFPGGPGVGVSVPG